MAIRFLAKLDSRIITCFLIAVACCFAGCQPRTESRSSDGAAAPKTESRKSDGPLIAHPEFTHWNQFPVKSYSVRKRVVTNEFGQIQVTTKFWLAEKSESQLRVESQITVQRPDEPLEVNSIDQFTYPASFSLPEGMSADFFSKPAAKAVEVAKETIRICDRDIDTTVYEWEENNEAGPMVVRLWRSSQIPGQIARQRMLTKSSKTSIEEEVIDFDTTGERILEVEDR